MPLIIDDNQINHIDGPVMAKILIPKIKNKAELKETRIKVKE